jgi:hypothetical protein
MVLDCRDELQSAWKAILDAGGPEAVPQAYDTFCRLPFNFSDGTEMAKKLLGMESQIETTRKWTFFFRAEYNKAIKLAKEGK